MLASGINVALLEVPVTVKVATGLSTSAMVNAMEPVGVFSGVVWSFMLVIVGGSLLAFTVKTKLVDAVADPSDTVIVMVAVPLSLPSRSDDNSSISTRSTEDYVGIRHYRCIA